MLYGKVEESFLEVCVREVRVLQQFHAEGHYFFTTCWDGFIDLFYF